MYLGEVKRSQITFFSFLRSPMTYTLTHTYLVQIHIFMHVLWQCRASKCLKTQLSLFLDILGQNGYLSLYNTWDPKLTKILTAAYLTHEGPPSVGGNTHMYIHHTHVFPTHWKWAYIPQTPISTPPLGATPLRGVGIHICTQIASGG
jgi:hypothetical protein